jgi:hypothetical protein
VRRHDPPGHLPGVVVFDSTSCDESLLVFTGSVARNTDHPVAAYRQQAVMPIIEQMHVFILIGVASLSLSASACVGALLYELLEQVKTRCRPHCRSRSYPVGSVSEVTTHSPQSI